MFNFRKLALTACAAAGATLLAGCSDYGYGYGGLSTGYGAPGYYDGYGSGYYGPYGYAGLGTGWYDGFYYPGSGYYVYDRGGRRHRWTDGQRRYWEGQRQARINNPGWRGPRGDGRRDRDDWRRGRIENRQAIRRGDGPREGVRPDRDANREAFRAQRQAAREAYRAQRPDGAARMSRGDWRGNRGFRGGDNRNRGNPQP